MRPSFIAHAITGILLLVVILLVIFYFNDIKNLSIDKIIGILLLFIIAIGIHGLLHMGEEIYFNYNPLNGNWAIIDQPIK